MHLSPQTRAFSHTRDWSAVAHFSNTISLSLLCTSLLHLPLAPPLPLQVYNIFTQKMHAIAHAQFTYACKCILPLFDYDGCIWGAYRILVNLTSGSSWPLGGISTNLYLSVSTVSVPSWRHGFLFMTSRTFILRTLLSHWNFLFSELWSHCSYNHGALYWIPHPSSP